MLLPLHDNVLLEPVEAEQKTKGGIILPDAVKERPQIGVVLAVGEGRLDKTGKRLPMSVKKGQKVVYKKWVAQEIKLEGTEYIITEEKDIIAVIS